MDKFDFLQRLVKIEALKFGSFILASGQKSDFYLDLRYIPAFPDLFSDIIDLSATLIHSKLKPEVLIGIPLAGVPYSSGIGLRSSIPVQLLRKEKKEHGLKKMIEGPDIQNKHVLLVDDLISSGFSKEFAITEVRNAGGIVVNLFVIVDRRSEITTKWEEEWNVTIHSIFQITKEDIHSIRKRNS